MPERKIVYESLEHKADSGFLVKAPSLERLYIDAALALTDQLVELGTIQDTVKHTAAVTADDKESLMVKWLNEILFLFEKNKFLCKRIVFTKFDGKNIQASLHGDTYSPIRHGHVSEIKAVTYHQLQIGDLDHPDLHFFAKIFLDL